MSIWDWLAIRGQNAAHRFKLSVSEEWQSKYWSQDGILSPNIAAVKHSITFLMIR